MNTYYKPSGKFSLLSIIYLGAVAVTLLPAFAWLYAYAIWYCPFIYINFFITMAFGGLVGMAIHFIVIGLGKVRNTKLTVVLGLLGGIWAWYLHWAIWINLAMNAKEGHGILISHINYEQLFVLLTNPASLLKLAGQINDTGLWNIFTIQVSGFILAIVSYNFSLILT